jgi:hypothetical protein
MGDAVSGKDIKKQSRKMFMIEVISEILAVIRNKLQVRD